MTDLSEEALRKPPAGMEGEGKSDDRPVLSLGAQRHDRGIQFAAAIGWHAG